MVGLAVLVFELTASRVVAPYIGTTIYTWTSIIGVILGALALGYGLGGYLADRRKRVEDVVLLMVGAGLFIFALTIIKDSYLSWLSATVLPFKLQGFLASMVLFFVPTLLLGMTSPYLARLSIVDVGTSGKHIARINAAGAAGSLVGVFLAGYVLFDYLGTNKILGSLAISLILATFILSRSFRLVERVLLILILLAAMFYATSTKSSDLVSDQDSAYQRILVRDVSFGGRNIRVMQTDKLGLQSGINLYDKQELVFPYTRAFNYLAEAEPGAKNYLIIGGGTFTLASKLANDKPGAQIDVVEIDSKLEDISREYFGFESKPNLKIINADGRQFLNTNQKLYDMVFIDAFNSITPPFQLSTHEAVQYLRGSLNEGGLVAVNVISAVSGSDAKTIESLTKTYREVFDYIEVFQVNKQSSPDNFAQNLILLASDRPLDGAGLAGDLNYSEEAVEVFGEPILIDHQNGIILSDDYAPLENMLPGSL